MAFETSSFASTFFSMLFLALAMLVGTGISYYTARKNGMGRQYLCVLRSTIPSVALMWVAVAIVGLCANAEATAYFFALAGLIYMLVKHTFGLYKLHTE